MPRISVHTTESVPQARLGAQSPDHKLRLTAAGAETGWTAHLLG
jgi:hypothetical protein